MARQSVTVEHVREVQDAFKSGVDFHNEKKFKEAIESFKKGALINCADEEHLPELSKKLKAMSVKLLQESIAYMGCTAVHLNELIHELGGLDILVNNAAGNFLCPSEELSHKGFAAVVDIVLNGTFHCTSAAGRHWISEGKPGTVLNIAATYWNTGSSFVLPSACAKAGVVALTRSLSVEWARHRIRLNAIAPGPIPTEGAFSRLLPDERLIEAHKRRIPAGRFGRPEELAELAAFLVSDAADWMRGEVVTFDGGEWLYGAGEFNSLLELPESTWDELRKRAKR